MTFRRRLSQCAVAGLLAAGLLAPAAHAQAAASGAPPLGGVNVIQGSSSGYADVTIPQPVVVDTDFDATRNKTFTLEGGGSLAAVVLRSFDDGKHTNPVVVAGRYDPGIFCSGMCTKPYPMLSVLETFTEHVSDFMYRIPAGRYRLYLITGGGPARATIRLGELSGERELEADHPVNSKVFVNPRRDSGLTDGAAVFGTVGQLNSYGLILTEGIAYTENDAQHVWDECAYNGAPAHPLAYYPGCPTMPGEEDAGQTIFPNAYSPGSYFSARYTETRVKGIGASFTDAGIVDSVGWAGAWIDLDPPQSGGDQPAPASAEAANGGARATADRTVSESAPSAQSASAGRSGRAALGLRVARRAGSARLANRRHLVSVTVRSDTRFSALSGVLLGRDGRGRPLASGRLSRLVHSGVLRLRTRRALRAGRYVLRVTATGADGQRRTARFGLALGR